MIHALLLASFAFMCTAFLSTLMRETISEVNYTNLDKWLGERGSRPSLRWSPPAPPAERPTSGEVWPKPQNYNKSDDYYTLVISKFDIKITNIQCQILVTALFRFIDRLGTLRSLQSAHRDVNNLVDGNDNSEHPSDKKHITLLLVNLTKPCEKYPHLDMDEKYELNISSTTMLKSDSIWGALRGLETLAQLFYFQPATSEICINGGTITDYPSYPHRGFMLDTARTYISLENILKTLDAMAMNKMNVFHWHIVDDQSFPYQSKKFPELSEKGAFHSSMVYSAETIADVVEYARIRGIRVVPEFSMPGQTRSLSKSHPEILTECFLHPLNAKKMSGLGPMDPSKKITYKLLRDLLREAQELFPDENFHIGGDQPNVQCWSSNPKIRNFMAKNNMQNATQLLGLFLQRVKELFRNGTVPIISQTFLESEMPIPKETIVQVWNLHWIPDVTKMLSRNRRVILSSPWHINIARNSFAKMYSEAAPRAQLASLVAPAHLPLLLGGEACVCGDIIDNDNFISRSWPRACAVAELLWSAAPDAADFARSRRRAEEHACRMRAQGIHADVLISPRSCLP